MFSHLNWFDRRNWVLATLLAMMAVAALLGVFWIVVSEGREYAAWSNGEEYHSGSYNDGFAVAAAAILSMLGLFLLFQMAAERFIERGLPFAEEIKDEESKTPPPPSSPLAVIELVKVPPGQEEGVRELNQDLFTLEEARRMLNLYAPVAKSEIAHLERLLGIDALLERKHGYLVRLGRRGFHGY